MRECEDLYDDGFATTADASDLSVDEVSDDQATVEPRGDEARGILVHEGGGWKVVVDPVVLSFGPTAEDAVRDYVDAYSEGDCLELVDYVSLANLGDRSRFFQECSFEALRRKDSGEKALLIAGIDVTFSDDATATADVSFVDDFLPGRDKVALVREGLWWKLDGTFAQVRYDELRWRLVDAVTGPGGGDCGPPQDAAADDVGDEGIGLRRSFPACYVAVGLYEVPDTDGLAERLADAVTGETVDVLGYVRGHGVRTAQGSVITLALQDYVVMVEMAFQPDLAVATELLELQLHRL